eukprot:531506-Hanusia_phi.AAC.2
MQHCESGLRSRAGRQHQFDHDQDEPDGNTISLQSPLLPRASRPSYASPRDPLFEDLFSLPYPLPSSCSSRFLLLTSLPPAHLASSCSSRLLPFLLLVISPFGPFHILVSLLSSPSRAGGGPSSEHVAAAGCSGGAEGQRGRTGGRHGEDAGDDQ